jgi:hypothetical protein
MMGLKYAAQRMACAMRAKARIQFMGRTPRGHKLWTKEEDEKVITLYPDYKVLRKTLRQRSFCGIKSRASRLNVTRKRHCWTGPEISKLRKLYPKASHKEILEAFPGLHWSQIRARARYAGFRRARKAFKETGYPILDDIRSYAFELNLNMVELDKMAKTKRYFQKAQWISSGSANHKAILRAITALGGQLRADWESY